MTGGRWWWAGVALANGIGVIPAWQAESPAALLFTACFGYAVAVLLYSKGGRTTDPLPAPPLIESDRAQRQADLTRHAAEHAEWDRAWRRICPPEAHAVWYRSPVLPERTAPRKITDFNN